MMHNTITICKTLRLFANPSLGRKVFHVVYCGQNKRTQSKKKNVTWCLYHVHPHITINCFLKFCQVLTNRICLEEARVVRKMDSAIDRINHYPLDSVVCFVNIYPLESDLSGG